MNSGEEPKEAAEQPGEPVLLRCPIDGEEYWSDRECPRASIHGKILGKREA